VGLFRRLYRGTNDFDFPKGFRRAGVLSIILVVISIVSLFTRGVVLSIDFEGGSVWEVPSADFTAEEAQDVLAAADTGGGEKFQEAESVEGDQILRISGQVDSVQEGTAIAVQLAEAAGLDEGEVTVNTVGPSWGEDITRQARTSLIVFMVLIAIYITWRLEARMAVAALVAVVHDILLTVGVYSLLQITITPATVISFLTILGFSLYDTIVVYDRVQENGERLGRTGRYTYTAIMRRSLNQVLMRSINTTITTVLPIISMLVVGKYLFGQQTLGDFSLALLIGLISGTYSSLFVAAPLTVALKEREARWKEVRSRLVNRGVDPNDTSWHGIGVEARASAGVASTAAAAVAPSPTAGGPPAAGAGPEAPRLTPGGHPPRPRKKKRR
jgi:preprotein translocase subunit SecF